MGDSNSSGGDSRSLLMPRSTRRATVLNDKYLLGEEIGKGAFGQVYKGIDQDNGNVVAIKEVSLDGLSEEDLHGIESEIDLMRTLSHRNIVQYLNSVKAERYLYIILEFVENGALSNVIRPSRFGAFPESLVALYVAQVLEGLAYLHAQGVIHRDVKGANILTTKEGLVKLADFGVATRLEGEIAKQDVVGTPYWMAPEVIEMEGICANSDIWSVGCTVIELVTSQPPYYDLQPMPALFRIVQDERPPIPEQASSLLKSFLKECFQKQPSARPTAQSLLEHRWIRKMRRDLKSSWPRQRRPARVPSSNHVQQDNSNDPSSSATDNSSPQNADQHESMATVVERMLERVPEPTGEAPPTPGAATAASNGSADTEPYNEQDERAGPHLANWLEALSLSDSQRSKDAQANGSSREKKEASVNNDSSPTEIEAGGSQKDDKEDRKMPPGSAISAPSTPEAGETEWDAKTRNLANSLSQANAHHSANPIIWSPHKHTETPAQICESILQHIWDCSATKATKASLLLTMPLSDIITCASPSVTLALQICNRIANNGKAKKGNHALRQMCTLGIIPALMHSAKAEQAHDQRLESARMMKAISNESVACNQLLACNGAFALVNLLEEVQRGPHVEMTSLALECIQHCLALRKESIDANTDAYLRLFASCGIVLKLDKLICASNGVLTGEGSGEQPGSPSRNHQSFQNSSRRAHSLSSCGNNSNSNEASHGNETATTEWTVPTNRQAMETMTTSFNLLTDFASSPGSAASAVAKQEGLLVLKGLLASIHPDFAPYLLRIFTLLSDREDFHDPLERVGVLQALVAYLPNTRPNKRSNSNSNSNTNSNTESHPNQSTSTKLQLDALVTISNACVSSRHRQDVIAIAGAAGPSILLAKRGGKFEQCALPLVCSLAHASRRSRAELWRHDGLSLLLGSISSDQWRNTVVDAVVTWAACEPSKLEGVLTEKKNNRLLVEALCDGQDGPMQKSLHHLQRLASRAPKISASLIDNGMGLKLTRLLREGDPATRLSSLQIIKSLYETHRNPKALVAKLDLNRELRSIVDEKSDSAGHLSHQVAQQLLTALHVNSFL